MLPKQEWQSVNLHSQLCLSVSSCVCVSAVSAVFGEGAGHTGGHVCRLSAEG